MRFKRYIIVPSLLAAVLGLSGCFGSDSSASVDTSGTCREVSNNYSRAHQEVTEAQTAVNSATEGTPARAQAEADLELKKTAEAVLKTAKDAACDDDVTDAASTSAAPSGTAPTTEPAADVVDTEGSAPRTVPVVTDNGTAVEGDSTTDPRTPATYADARKHGVLNSWSDVVTVMGDQQWYVDGINARKSRTGFDWSDVQRWANCNIEARVITVHHMNITDREARDKVRSLIGNDADKLQIVHVNYDIMNTRGFGHNKMEDFQDSRQMVRVQLAKVVTKDGDPCGAIDPTSGVQADCYNLVWKPFSSVPAQPTTTTSSTTQTTVTQTTTAGPSSTTVTTTPRTTATSTSAAPTTHTTSTPTRTPVPTPTTTPPDKNHSDSPVGTAPNTSDPRTNPQEDSTGQVTHSSSAPSSTAQPTVDPQPEDSDPVPPSGDAPPSGVSDGDPGMGD